MREAIEKVIAELEVEHKRNFEVERDCKKIEDRYYRQGGQDGLSFAIDKLKAVIAEDESNPKSEQHAPES